MLPVLFGLLYISLKEEQKEEEEEARANRQMNHPYKGVDTHATQATQRRGSSRGNDPESHGSERTAEETNKYNADVELYNFVLEEDKKALGGKLLRTKAQRESDIGEFMKKRDVFVWDIWAGGWLALHMCVFIPLIILFRYPATVVSTYVTGQAGTLTGTTIAGATITTSLTVYPIVMVMVMNSIAAIMHMMTGLWATSDLEKHIVGVYLMLRAERNWARFLGSVVTHSTMFLTVAVMCNVVNISTLMCIAGSVVSWILFWELGSRLEGNDKKRAFWYGCVTWLVPWIVIATQLGQAGTGVPWFSWSIASSLFLLTGMSCIVEALRVFGDKPASFTVTETRHTFVSAITYTALTWQVFAATYVVNNH